jgi:hypothetical protein
VTADVEMAELKRSFPRVLLGVAICFVLLGGIIAAFASNADRPEGAAEHWLNDVGDTTRKGVQADARERAAKIGSLVLADQILPPGTDTDGKAAFTSIEVGAAVPRQGPLGPVEEVPFRVRIRDTEADVYGALAMTKATDGWHVIGLGDRSTAGDVPSEGGAAIAKASLPVYAGAILVGILITLGVSLLVRRLGPQE